MCSATKGAFLFVFLVGLMTLFQESSGKGVIYWFSSDKYPKIETIPPVVPPAEREGFLEKIKSILQGHEVPRQNESDDTNIGITRKVTGGTRIRGLDVLYYHYLPTDRMFLVIISGLVLTGILGIIF